MQPVKYVATCKKSLTQLNLDSPQHALSNGYRVWGVKVALGYEGKVRSAVAHLLMRYRLISLIKSSLSLVKQVLISSLSWPVSRRGVRFGPHVMVLF